VSLLHLALHTVSYYHQEYFRNHFNCHGLVRSTIGETMLENFAIVDRCVHV